MRIRRTTDEEGQSGGGIINLAPLVDVMFILIIFFLAATTFKQEEFDILVKLPQASGQSTLSATTRLIIINVRQNGQYLLGANKLDLSGLRDNMVKIASENPQQKVLIRGDEAARHGHVAGAVAVCRQAGILQANIGYDYKPLK